MAGLAGRLLTGFALAAASALALTATATPGRAAPADGSYVLGVVPSAPPVTMHANWMPIVERLAQATGLSLTLKVYEKMPDFEADLERGGPDFAFSNPMQIVLFHAAQGYVPLVRSSQPLVGVLFVPVDSPIRTVEELEGKQIAFVGAKSV
jgi:phosphonate transport system substrate-binding protein